MTKYVTVEELKKALESQTKQIFNFVDQRLEYRIEKSLEDYHLKIKDDLMQFKDDIVTEYRKVDLEQTMLVGRVADHESRLEKIEERFSTAN